MTPDVPRVVIAGATGRTGNAVAHGLAGRDDVVLAACVSPSLAGTPARPTPDGVAVFAQLSDVDVPFDVLVDLTHEGPAQENIAAALERGAHVVVGTTGLPEDELDELGRQAEARGLGVLYAPNFAIGAVLMTRFAQEAARYLQDVEIIELHHQHKRDAPSGTARRTAQLVGAARGPHGDPPGGGAPRGDLVAGVPVHSLRLPGAVAHQDVIFGAEGERLTIRHDALDRTCYAAGVARAARGVSSFTGLRTGLEHVL